MSDHVLCPWWMGYFLASPLRRLYQNPERILAPHVKAGMVALDVGSAMGYFTLPMARLVGGNGRVIAVDLQEKMIRSLKRRAHRAGLSGRIETRTCSSRSLGIDDLADRVDFALAFAVLHEMPDARGTFTGVYRSLRAGGRLLLAEPSGHVTVEEFARTTATANESGFNVVSTPTIRSSRSLLLAKP
jgi:ubiquinone/menaquinone biosynthesis C-methylase UbiE